MINQLNVTRTFHLKRPLQASCSDIPWAIKWKFVIIRVEPCIKSVMHGTHWMLYTVMSDTVSSSLVFRPNLFKTSELQICSCKLHIELNGLKYQKNIKQTTINYFISSESSHIYFNKELSLQEKNNSEFKNMQ